MHDLSVWLGGSDDDAALDLVGTRLTYGQLRQRILRAEPGRIELDDPIQTLVQFYSAVANDVIAVVSAAPIDGLAAPPGTALVVTTSGSAGNPRAVARTAASWLDSFAPFTELTGLGSVDVVALSGPLVGTLHLFAAVHALAIGAQLTDDLTRATAVHCVPNYLRDALRRRPPLLRLAIVAGGVFRKELEMAAVSAGLQVVEYYGATELSFVASRRIPSRLTPFPGVEIEIREGRIWARSSYLALGYAGSSVGPLVRDETGFASVGDLGEWLDGGIRVLGRDSSAITVGGDTLLADDIETILAGLEFVVAVAVVGQDHPRFGQIVVAVLELLPGYSAAALRQQARHLLSPAALPRLWFAVDHMPRVTSGKIARGLISDGLADGSLSLRALT